MFKIMQFNMQFGQMWDETDPYKAPIDLDLTIEEILRHDADIIMLQEVEHALPQGMQLDPPPNFMRLQAALDGYHSYFSYPKADPRELPFGIGLAIFSKTPLHELFRLELPSSPVEFEFEGKRKTPTDRLLIGAKTVVEGRELQIFNTHLLAYFMLKSSSETHPEQRRLVVDLMRRTNGPALIAGDFNVSDCASLVRQFSEAGFRAVQDSEITWRFRPYVLDHIFYSEHLRPVRHAVEPTVASDHHVLIAEFEFRE